MRRKGEGLGRAGRRGDSATGEADQYRSESLVVEDGSKVKASARRRCPPSRVARWSVK